MAVQSMDSKHPSAPHRPGISLLTYGFWLVTLALLLNQLLVVIPAYRGGLLPAYNAGWSLKDMSFPIPLYTPYSLVTSILFFPVLLLITFVNWVAPLVTLVWGVRLGQLWHRVPRSTKCWWLLTLVALWGLTVITKTASTAFLIWLLD